MNQPVMLYVEDEQDDVLLMQFAFQRANLNQTLKIARDGQEAKDYLTGQGGFGDRDQNPAPCLVLLDLNLPGIRGLELLGWIREQPELKSLPVVIYSSSQQKQDIEQAHALGASDYIFKKAEVAAIATMLGEVSTRWSGAI